MSEELEILKLTCKRLEDSKIPYMLTGSLAANFYAVPRMTRDIDIVVEILEINASKFFQIFQSDFYIDKTSISDAIKREGMFNIIHNDTIFKVDFVVRKNSDYRITEFQRRRRVELDNIPIWIVSPEDLIISKLIWTRDIMSDTQIKDVKNLLISTKDLDKGYIEQWVQKFGLNNIYEKVKADG